MTESSVELVVVILAILLLVSAVATGVVLRRQHTYKAEIARLREEAESREKRPAIIAHEIRTPLALVRGAAELLAEQTPGPLNERQLEFMETITENVSQVIDIAENFILQVHLDEDLVMSRKELVNVRDVVYETAREMRRISRVPIHVDASGGPIPIYSDPQRIRQVVWNLVNNAVRHAGEGIAVTVRVSPSENRGVLLSVSDTGTGMSEEDLEKLFTPFATGSSRRPGSGIGMMVTKQIVEAHGGKIMVDSESGHGTAILVSLPAGRSHELGEPADANDLPPEGGASE